MSNATPVTPLHQALITAAAANTAGTVLITAAPESELSKARRRTSALTRGMVLPDAFATSTSATYARALSKPVAKRTASDKRTVRRLARHERLVGAVQVGVWL